MDKLKRNASSNTLHIDTVMLGKALSATQSIYFTELNFLNLLKKSSLNDAP